MLEALNKTFISKQVNYNDAFKKQNVSKNTCSNDFKLLSFKGACALKSITFAATAPIVEKKFASVRADENHPDWDKMISRVVTVKPDPKETRSAFRKDHDKILYSNSFSRLKGKAQVVMNPTNDLVCTRMDHVLQVASVSENIAERLGLNTDLARAISIGHDLGHSPFGHEGEEALQKIINDKELDINLWHEKNGLRVVDKTETLTNADGVKKNLNLTYAVRDGIISHCGEVHQNNLRPREDFIDLENITKPKEYQPYTWEGCVVRVADQIAYLGRDIEDAMRGKILSPEKKQEVVKLAGKCLGKEVKDVNSAMLINGFVNDLCENSSPEKGIGFSEKYNNLMKEVKAFNLKNIYRGANKNVSDKYINTLLVSTFETLEGMYDEQNPEKGTLKNIRNVKNVHPKLCGAFESWLVKFSDIEPEERQKQKYENEVIYDLNNKKDYQQAVVDFITGMTDNFAIRTHNEQMYL